MRLKIIKTDHEPHEETISWIAIRDRVKIYVSAKLEPLEQSVDAAPPAKPQRAKRFTINTQVIALSIVLIVMIAILATRIVIRLRQRRRGG
jgi:hypothetical protein